MRDCRTEVATVTIMLGFVLFIGTLTHAYLTADLTRYHIHVRDLATGETTFCKTVSGSVQVSYRVISWREVVSVGWTTEGTPEYRTLTATEEADIVRSERCPFR